MVVGAPGSLNGRDTWLRDRLEDAGWSVTIGDDDTVTSGSATGKNLVVISESTAQASVGTKFTAVTVPVIVGEWVLYDEMGMTATGSANQGTVASQTQIAVTNAGAVHTLGAGLPAGTHTTSSSAISHAYGKPASGAIEAATIAGDAAKPTVFAYDTGQTMVSGTAPARRVGWYVYSGNATVPNATATKLFDAAVAWAAQTPPTIGYTRDAADRIIERTVNTRVEARYSYTGSGDTSDLTLDGNSNIVEATLPLPGGALYTWRSAGEVWSWPNLNGHITAITNNTGTKQGPTRNYDPYGNPLTATTIPIDNSNGEMDYAWHGQQQRPLEHQPGAIPTIEMGARQYDPMLGRFLELDPVEGGNLNSYLYPVDPLNQSDLDGLFCMLGSNPNGSCRGSRFVPGTRHSARHGFCYTGKTSKRGCRGSSVARRVNVGVSVCPVFGCLSLGFNGGRVQFAGGSGLAVSTPGLFVSRASAPARRGWTGENSLFGTAIVGGGSWNWKGQNIRNGNGGWFVGYSHAKSKLGRSGLGGGYVHNWIWTA